MEGGMNALRHAFRLLALPALLVALWHHASQQGVSAAYAFVPLSDIWTGFVELAGSGELLLHLSASLGTALTGLACGSIAGFLLGTLMALSRPLDAMLSPLFNALRQVPTMGLIPVIALWFGTGEFSIKLLVSIATFEAMTLSAHEGIRNVERRYLELGRSLMFSRGQTLAKILLPAAFPSLLTGLLQSVSLAWMATVGAELLFTVGPGLGVIMERAQIAARMDLVIVCLVFIGLLGTAMNAFCAALGRRVLRWQHFR
jgi:sulfonate transport system permease protein